MSTTANPETQPASQKIYAVWEHVLSERLPMKNNPVDVFFANSEQEARTHFEGLLQQRSPSETFVLYQLQVRGEENGRKPPSTFAGYGMNE